MKTSTCCRSYQLPFEVSIAYLTSNPVVDNEKTASCKVTSENVDESHYTSETYPLNANVNDEIIAFEELSEWPTLSELQYCQVMLEGQEEPVVALKDSGAEQNRTDFICQMN